MGKSEKPLTRYSTSEMARDLIEIFDHLGWTDHRQLHIMGVSMGGMIAQELGCLIPERIASLNLLSTAARLENTVGFVENLRNRINMFLPKSLDRSVSDAAASLFPHEWLAKPDDTEPPKAGTPEVVVPPGGYKMFDSNFDRFAAQELTKRADAEAFQRKGFILQAIAAGWHHKSAAQLKEMAEKIGRERILVMHGTEDKMITVHHGRVLIADINPGTAIIREGSGHVLMLEAWKWFNETITHQLHKTQALEK